MFKTWFQGSYINLLLRNKYYYFVGGTTVKVRDYINLPKPLIYPEVEPRFETKQSGLWPSEGAQKDVHSECSRNGDYLEKNAEQIGAKHINDASSPTVHSPYPPCLKY